jgi:hypothetical protein
MGNIMNQNRRYLVREYDYRTGETIDQSPQAVATSPTGTAVSFITTEKGRGVYFKSATSRLVYGATDSLGSGNITIIALIKPDSIGATNGRIIDNGKTIFYIAANKLGFCSDGATATVFSAASSLVYSQNSVVAVTRTTGSIANFFINGVQSGTRNQSSGTIAAASTNTFIGNQAIYNTILSEQAIAQISDELMTEKPLTLPAVTVKSDVNLLMDGNMEWSDTRWWAAYQAATLSKQTGTPYKGTQCLRVAYNGSANPGATQSIFVQNKRYRITGRFRGDGTAIPRIGSYSGSGVFGVQGTSSTAWQSFDYIGREPTAGWPFLYLQAITAVAGYVEFDDLKIVEVPALTSYQSISYPAFYDNGGVGYNRSFADETGGQLANTGWNIITGSWRVENQGDPDKTKKQITCTSTGVLSLPIPLMGYWKFDLYKGNAGNTTAVLLASILPSDHTVAANNGYRFAILSTETVATYSFTGGTATARCYSGASYVSETGWYSIIVKRYPGGIFYTYIKGGTQFPTWTLVSVAGGGGANPFTNNTYTTSQYINLQFGTGDAIRNMEFSPDFSQLLVSNNI